MKHSQVLNLTNLYEKRFFFEPESSFSGLVDLVERVLRHFQHLHVRPELFDQSFDDFSGGGARRHSDALRRDLLAAGAVLRLVVEPHHAVELEMLKSD